MTNQEELQYLTALVLEASKWRISEGDDSDTIRLEVQDRIRRLTGINTTDENGLNQSEPVQEETEPGEFVEQVSKTPSKQTLSSREAKRRYTQTHTRAWFDGKQSFYPNDQIVDIMLPNNRIKHVHRDSNEYKQYQQQLAQDRFHLTPGQLNEYKQCQQATMIKSEPVDKLGDDLWAAHEKGGNNG